MLIKNKSTEENRKFWEHVEDVAANGQPPQFRKIKPLGSKILDHPNFDRWFKQGYAKQEADGLWLHYTAICDLLRDNDN